VQAQREKDEKLSLRKRYKENIAVLRDAISERLALKVPRYQEATEVLKGLQQNRDNSPLENRKGRGGSRDIPVTVSSKIISPP